MFGKLFELYPDTTKYNWDVLKTMGKVTEEKTCDKETGLTTITRTFESTGGLMTISSSESYYTKEDEHEEYTKLKQQLDEALETQNYEKAIELRDSIRKLKKKGKKDTN